ncbi:hypothetical protein MGYG_08382 [Nannizzia gypsea CBS 118893]|uniref:Uncharacterized protein n=1 Tax=Arthroderma gypseum (strain ATCC MYA-4604 / CBS 118893) TaxID=535722 RepID=E4V5J6_ARTGP|nr:hypothetical protein MGYG_08382 [Nannizzia gypsea CBS 118893]EFR05371.1 hypothetical protein MGYG_08382 [Nannizzia gypsea CBS 118893]
MDEDADADADAKGYVSWARRNYEEETKGVTFCAGRDARVGQNQRRMKVPICHLFSLVRQGWTQKCVQPPRWASSWLVAHSATCAELESMPKKRRRLWAEG